MSQFDERYHNAQVRLLTLAVNELQAQVRELHSRIG